MPDDLAERGRGNEIAPAHRAAGARHRRGQRVAGIYRRSVMFTSGHFAMIDEGMSFLLVPWRLVIERRLGQQLAATVRGGGVSWEIGRQRGPAI